MELSLVEFLKFHWVPFIHFLQSVQLAQFSSWNSEALFQAEKFSEEPREASLNQSVWKGVLGQNSWVELARQCSERTRKGEFSSKSSSWELHLAKKSYFYKWEFCSEWFRDPHHWVFWALTLYSLWPKHVRHYVRLPTEALNFFSHGGNVIFSNNWGFKKTCSGSRMGSTLFPPINFKRIRLSSFPAHWSPLLNSLHT